MPYQLPTLEDVCLSALLQYSSHTKAALQQVLPGQLRAQLTRRIIIEGKVTATVVALYTWTEKSLVVGDLCCREPSLFEHGRSVAVDDLLPQILQHSLGRVRPPPPLTEPPRAPLPIPFLCARFLELVMSGHAVPLRHLDLTFYGLLDLVDLVPVLEALRFMHSADAARGLEFHNPHTLSVSISFSAATHLRDLLDGSVEKLGRLLEQQARRPVRCVLRITGFKSAGGEQQRRARRLLRMLARHNCPLELLVARGPHEWGKNDQATLVERFTHLRMLGLGTCERLGRRGGPSGEPLELPLQYNVRSLSLTGCTLGPARRLKTACLPSGWLRSLSVSASLLGLFSGEELRQLRRLSIVHGHGAAEARPQHMDRFLQSLSKLRDLQLLLIDDLLGESQIILLAIALPQLESLRFVRFPTGMDEPLAPLTALCAGARLAPLLTALHVKLVRQLPVPVPAELDFPMMAYALRVAIGPPLRENVCLYLTEAAPRGLDTLDQLWLLPL